MKTILKKKNLLPQDLKDIEENEALISRECEDIELKKLKDVVVCLETKEGNTNIWRQMRKAFPKKKKPLQTGVKNIEAKVITNREEKKHVILKHFAHRMRKRPVKDEVTEIVDLNEKLFKQRLTNVKSVRSSPFSMEELTITLKNLTLGKSRDPDNLVCDIFKEGVIGDNLKESILMMMNRMKEEIKVPECLRTANVTMLHKKKSKLDLNNWRGVFVTSVLRTILMKMLHARTYDIVTESMTDSQIGAKKKNSVRNHLFILNSIISDVTSSVKKTPIDLGKGYLKKNGKLSTFGG